jgi:hypothetical protein
MHSTGRSLVGSAGLLAAIVATGVMVSAAPAAAPTGGTIALFATVGNNPTSKIVVAGAIGDWGTAATIDKNGRRDEHGNYVKVTLRKGSFEINSTALNKATASPRPQVASDQTCSISTSGSAPVTLFNGTGLYKGISGRLKLTLSFAGVGRRYQSGPNKGQCLHSDTQPPLAMLGSVTGHGTIHFTH